jgi:hypothetical protein
MRTHPESDSTTLSSPKPFNAMLEAGKPAASEATASRIL